MFKVKKIKGQGTCQVLSCFRELREKFQFNIIIFFYSTLLDRSLAQDETANCILYKSDVVFQVRCSIFFIVVFSIKLCKYTTAPPSPPFSPSRGVQTTCHKSIPVEECRILSAGGGEGAASLFPRRFCSLSFSRRIFP